MANIGKPLHEIEIEDPLFEQPDPDFPTAAPEPEPAEAPAAEPVAVPA